MASHGVAMLFGFWTFGAYFLAPIRPRFPGFRTSPCFARSATPLTFPPHPGLAGIVVAILLIIQAIFNVYVIKTHPGVLEGYGELDAGETPPADDGTYAAAPYEPGQPGADL